ncbi:GDSL esterase/lipase At2g40250-like [Papaver somniferum]|uniref:GDSL esterase/lipase At2g40250-like n=1 Tax=Papaver somniferum TaxID=3469 RepID=UPI000E6F9F3F|nr:GDSL esterase/lipase At2g40250-like [Papaver somniferum]
MELVSGTISGISSGNNDYITTLFTGDHLPYGRDFPGHAAPGRFTNGRLIGDFLVSYLGLKRALPSYLAPNLSDQELLSGVSFASAGTGFDELTAQTASVINMDTQIRYLGEYLEKIKNIVGAEKSGSIINNGLFIISAATNDMVFNYYDLSLKIVQYSLPEFHDFLLHILVSIVQV